MGPVKKKTAAGTALDAERLGRDPELLAATLEVFQQLDLDQQLRTLSRRAREWIGASGAFALGPGEERGQWTAIAGTVDADDPRFEAFGSIEAGKVPSLLEGQPRVFDGLGPFAEIADPWPGPPPPASIALPVRGVDEDVVAALLLLLDESPSAEHLERLEHLVDAVRPAVRNALQVASMRELVIKDDTASCFNRRYFESTLPVELARASRFHSALSLIFLDMDNLKEVNTRHGHAMGSRTLLEVSRRIRLKIRRFDRLFRFGGDEFCIVLPETEWHGALEVAERVRDAIARKPFLVSALGESRGVRMTASLGISSYPLHARTKEELIAHADRAMQRIKNETKNSIGIAEIVGGNHGN